MTWVGSTLQQMKGAKMSTAVTVPRTTTVTKQLLDQLKRLNEHSPHLLTANLEDRKREEVELHDRKRDTNYLQALPDQEREKLLGNYKFYRVTKDFAKYIDGWIATHSPSKVVLDYACGHGHHATMAAQCGAALAIGIDISGVSVEIARKDAEAAGVQDRTFFVQGDCENTRLPDSSIDVVICSGMLHHLDLSYAFPELRRILKPGGVVFAAEALSYNPLIRLYRKCTPKMRSKWEAEHILSYRDLRFARRFFEVKDVRHWTLVALWGFYMPSFLSLFRWIDSFLMTVPLIKLMSWTFTFELHKPQKAL
jgi:ubiquinone/menaquinone biosynthesis C-methylase UbiE